jgi:hypothetical protein
MSVEDIRLNIKVRDDTRPLLYNAIVGMPGKPRAEFIRSLCEQALRANQSIENPTSDNSKVSDTDSSENSDGHFADDLAGLLGKKERLGG